ncbi:MAG TPA: hypothetical protein VNO83_15390 [Pseudonocardia sp.]|nr:hypothetical protein [Pseudonocardia sp.]
MGRRRRRDRPPPPRLASAGITRAETGPDGDWLVRSVPGAASTKPYRCPGCDQLIPAGAPHVVAWPAAEFGSVEDRRHWHASCWAARHRRGPGGRRR